MARIIVVYLFIWIGIVLGFPDLPLCGAPTPSYALAKRDYPDLVPVSTYLDQFPIASWWTDNNQTYRSEMELLFSACNESTIPTIVLYALPNKDCAAGYSNKGFVRDSASYLEFVQELVTLVGNRPVIYVMEPDALGLAAEEGCGKSNKYLENMQKALPLLTMNPNARVYFDVGFWMLKDHAHKIADAVNFVASTSRVGGVRGIVLNTSNYRKTEEMAELCSKFIQATNNGYRCVLDTSRNYRTPNTTEEWCNNKHAGIGAPPTSHTDYPDSLDYYLWIKVPGESDGECNSSIHSKDAMPGPRAAVFFEKAFSMQWDRGYFVDKKLGVPLGKYDTGLDFGVQLDSVPTSTIQSKVIVIGTTTTTSSPAIDHVSTNAPSVSFEAELDPTDILVDQGLQSNSKVSDVVIISCVIVAIIGLAFVGQFLKKRREIFRQEAESKGLTSTYKVNLVAF